MATEPLRWPGPAWAIRERKEIITSAMAMTAYAKLALKHGIAGHRNIPLVKGMLPQIQAEARDILLACTRMRLARQESQYRLPNWVSSAIRDTERVASDQQSAANKGDLDRIYNIPTLAELVIRRCDAAKPKGPNDQITPKEWDNITAALDTSARAGQQIQTIIYTGLPPTGEDDDDLQANQAELNSYADLIEDHIGAGDKDDSDDKFSNAHSGNLFGY